MMMLRSKKPTRARRRRKLEKLWKKLLYGGNFILGSMIKQEIIFRNLLRVQLKKLESPRRLLMTISYKLEMEKSMGSISMKNSIVKSDN